MCGWKVMLAKKLINHQLPLTGSQYLPFKLTDQKLAVSDISQRLLRMLAGGSW